MTPPLASMSVAVTRPARRAETLRALFQREGARVYICPTIRIAPPRDVRPLLEAAARSAAYDWVVFTSATGVEALAAAAGAHPRVGGLLPSDLRVCAVGPATAAAAKARGLEVGLVPPRFVAESLVEILEDAGGIRGRCFLMVRASEARDLLPRSLEEREGRVWDVEGYRTLPDDREARRLVRLVNEGAVDLLTFTSGSTVRSFHSAWGASGEGKELPAGVRVATIGPVAADVARRLGMTVDLVPERYTADGLVEACVERFGRKGPPRA